MLLKFTIICYVFWILKNFSDMDIILLIAISVKLLNFF